MLFTTPGSRYLYGGINANSFLMTSNSAAVTANLRLTYHYVPDTGSSALMLGVVICGVGLHRRMNRNLPTL
jgi:hypothetical protein